MIHKIEKQIGLILIATVISCCQNSGPVVTLQKADGEDLQVKVEVADTPAARERGLMFRNSVPEGTGMLFIFPEETQNSFWMKNTPSSLDMIFIRDGLIVSMIEKAVPYSEEILTPDSSYTMVLEVPGGYAARHSVSVGDRVKIPDKFN